MNPALLDADVLRAAISRPADVFGPDGRGVADDAMDGAAHLPQLKHTPLFQDGSMRYNQDARLGLALTFRHPFPLSRRVQI